MLIPGFFVYPDAIYDDQRPFYGFLFATAEPACLVSYGNYNSVYEFEEDFENDTDCICADPSQTGNHSQGKGWRKVEGNTTTTHTFSRRASSQESGPGFFDR